MLTSRRFGSRQVAVTLTLLGVIAASIVLIFTPNGAGVTDDSVFYLSGAQSILERGDLSWPVGGEEREPLTHFPPLYPLFLAGSDWLGIDIAHDAGLLGAILFGCLVAAIGWLVYRHSASAGAGLIAAILALVSPTLLGIYIMVWSEVLFLLILVLTIACLAEVILGRGMSAVVVAGILAGLACLTRYAGVSLIATGFVSLLLLRPGNWRGRITAALTFAVIASIPFIGWFLRNAFIVGSLANRTLSYHPITTTNLQTAAYTISVWLLPGTYAFRIRVAAVLLPVVLAGGYLLRNTLASRRSRTRIPAKIADRLRVSWLLVFFEILYVAVLVTSLTFVDASTRLNARILSPAYLIALLWLFLVFDLRWLSLRARRFATTIAIGVWLMSVVFYVVQSYPSLERMRADGRGFSGRGWMQSETVQAVRELEKGGVLYSTEGLALQYLTGRPAYWVPEKIRTLEGTLDMNYESNMALMHERLKEPGGALILFNSSFVATRPELPGRDEIIDGLELLLETSDGEIYVDPANANKDSSGY
jgi:hypothetical protein